MLRLQKQGRDLLNSVVGGDSGWVFWAVTRAKTETMAEAEAFGEFESNKGANKTFASSSGTQHKTEHFQHDKGILVST
jgi:hypothetical protein